MPARHGRTRLGAPEILHQNGGRRRSYRTAAVRDAGARAGRVARV